LGGGRSIGGRPRDRAAFDARFEQMVRMYHQVAERALARGVPVHVHPTSTPDSLILVKAEYERLVAALDPSRVGLGPDTAHITRGDEPALDFVARHTERIVHVHLKDAHAGGDYAPMGSGDADIAAVARLLAERGYAGWFIAEEESEASGADPAAAVRASREYLRRLGY
ncbi:MAG: sugar phosphate isomerase/epimerase, partial [Chloroflexota bacterium]|nr:sugar phosphate isomerase/epimerase [Chloroflexota bacterium]